MIFVDASNTFNRQVALRNTEVVCPALAPVLLIRALVHLQCYSTLFVSKFTNRLDRDKYRSIAVRNRSIAVKNRIKYQSFAINIDR